MSKIIGRTYVSMLILSLAAKTASDAMTTNHYFWPFVIVHIVCLFLVIKDGVE